ncbi:MAG: hypothetical protein ISN29_06200 [Gammaproteobacteria bacterium AqS3]|nr:hypothetical protein [Gammaproteobacteria bacterium AqS3]
MKDFGKWILSGGLALAGISAPMAAAFDDPGFYVGAHFGSASAGDWCGETNKTLTGAINPTLMGAAAVKATAGTPAAVSFAGTTAPLVGTATHLTKGTSTTANQNLRMFADSTYTIATGKVTALNGTAATGAACGEDSGTSSGIFFGYRMNSNFAFEFATNSGVSTDTTVTSTFSTTPGEVTATARIVTSDGSVNTQPTSTAANTVTRVLAHTKGKTDYNYNISSEGETSGMVISALGFLPIGSGWQVYGRLGLNMWDGSTDHTAVLRGTTAAPTADYTAYRGAGTGGTEIMDDTSTANVDERQTTLLGSTVPSTVDTDLTTAGNQNLTDADKMALNTHINGHLAGLGADALYFTGLTPNGTELAGASGVEKGGETVPTSTTWKEESSGTGIVIGVGVEWIVSETLGLRAEYTQYGADDGYDLDGLFFSAIWKF